MHTHARIDLHKHTEQRKPRTVVPCAYVEENRSASFPLQEVLVSGTKRDTVAGGKFPNADLSSVICCDPSTVEEAMLQSERTHYIMIDTGTGTLSNMHPILLFPFPASRISPIVPETEQIESNANVTAACVTAIAEELAVCIH